MNLHLGEKRNIALRIILTSPIVALHSNHTFFRKLANLLKVIALLGTFVQLLAIQSRLEREP